MHKPIDQVTKDAILTDIKNGMRVMEAAAKHGLSDKTVYGWMRAQADNTGTSSLEVAKLRRENQDLKEIIGMFALEKKRAEKNHNGA